MLAPVIHILPLTVIQKERVLPIPGRVVVRQGQKVASRDVIAEADLAPEHLLLNIARSLGVSVERADELIQRVVGDEVDEGDLIAGPIGLTRRVVRAPSKGEIVVAGEGQVLLRVAKPPFELRAGIGGTVTELIPELGAIIQTTGALVQGVWGNGHADLGLMQNKLSAPDDVLKPGQVDVSLRGTIVLGGFCGDAEVLQKAADVPLRGLVVSSMSSALIPLALRMEFPVLVLEGFGKLAMNAISYNLLTTHQNREISVNAEAFNHHTGQRPEVIIPLPTSREPNAPSLAEEFTAGQKVRILRAPHQARTGTIESLYNEPVLFPSGLRLPAAQVQLKDGESVQVPLANLEVIA